MTIWTNGCFDILHAGHVFMLEHARKMGTRLVVGLDTDERVKANKNSKRPFHTLEQRMFVLKSLRCVDEVVSFSNDEELISRIVEAGAQLIVIGDDYKEKRVIGSEIVNVYFYKRIDNLSSSRILNEICF